MGPAADNSPVVKCYLTHALLPKYQDPLQPPSSKKPFSSILEQNFSSSLTLIVPNYVAETHLPKLASRQLESHYAKVILPLSALLQDDFLNGAIKQGDVSMLSEGQPGVDDQFFLHRGLLRLHLAKDQYERAGLQGTPLRDGSRKHVVRRYCVDIDLRSSSMSAGKKGFQRLIWAAENVLNKSLTWLFYDHEHEAHDSVVGSKHLSLLAKHFPTAKTAKPEKDVLPDVTVPDFDQLIEDVDKANMESSGEEILEWIDLVSIKGSQVCRIDQVDSYISRYQIPEPIQSQEDIIIIKWRGFLPGEWIRSVWIEMLRAIGNDSRAWLSISAKAFRTEPLDDKDGYCVLRPPLNTKKNVDDFPASQQSVRQASFLMWEFSTGSDAR